MSPQVGDGGNVPVTREPSRHSEGEVETDHEMRIIGREGDQVVEHRFARTTIFKAHHDSVDGLGNPDLAVTALNGPGPVNRNDTSQVHGNRCPPSTCCGPRRVIRDGVRRGSWQIRAVRKHPIGHGTIMAQQTAGVSDREEPRRCPRNTPNPATLVETGSQ